MIIVSLARNTQLQQHADQTHAETLLPSDLPNKTVQAVERKERRLVYLYKSVVVHDADGKAVGKRNDRVGRITLLQAEFSDIGDLTLEVAKECGYKTVQTLREAWDILHPLSPRVLIVWFALGDWTDRDVFMAPTGGTSGDYTSQRYRAMDPEAPVLSREQIDALSSANRQKDEAARAKASLALAAETPSQRLLRIDLLIEDIRVRLGDAAARQAQQTVRQERRIIGQRVKRAEGRKD